MDAAALLLLASAVGVGFGWQPMPDGSPRSEYVVQVEPEMLEALARGATIPIVSDVPANAGPVARVRLVVGRGELPRGQSVTRLKPSTDGVVLTQFTEPPAQRYGAPVVTPTVPPPATGSAAPTTYDPYTGVPPTGGGSWNPEPASPNPLRTAAAAEPAGASSWNGGTQPVETGGDLPAGPLPRIRAGIQQATEPLQQGIDNVGDGLRSAGQDIQGRTQRMMDELRGVANDATAAVPAAGWNGGAPATDAAGGALTSGGAAPPSGWNNGATTTTAGGAAQPYTPPYGSAAPPFVPTPVAAGGANADPWTNASGQQPPSSPSGGATDTAGTGGTGGTTTWPGTEPIAGTTVLEPPPLPTLPPATGQLGGPWGGTTTTTVTPTPVTSNPGSPAIDAAMLALPSDRTLEGTGPLSGGLSPAGTDILGGAAGAGRATSGGGPLLTSPGWANGGAAPATTPAAVTTPTPAAATPATSPGQQAAVLFAWVTLFASAAGNIYLFWSYLDVRTKYRALVRKTARAVGSRFSAA